MSKIIQGQFFKFHDNIKLEIEDNKPLIEKRDMLLDEIRAYLKKKSEKENKPLITFDVINLGSYSYGTGIKPAFDEDDYDIDIGLLFHINKNDYDPLEVKGWIYEALNSKPNRTVIWKTPCITVQYFEEKFPKFHVDFACFSNEDSNQDKQTYLAKGKPGAPKEKIKWEVSEPKVLKDKINKRFSDEEEKKQFKRIIRGDKRWKDLKFDTNDGQPKGIAFTALALNGFRPYVFNQILNEPEINDLRAHLEFTKYILTQFDANNQISVRLPVPPYNNLFAKMSPAQQLTFKNKLEKLKTVLNDAINEPDPHIACKNLQKEFGEDFPVPPKEDTAQHRRNTVIGTSESA